MGYILIYGTVLVRTWRIYRILTYYMNPGIFLSDKALFVYVLVLLFIGLCISVLWTSIDGRHILSSHMHMLSGFEVINDEVFEVSEAILCSSNFDIVWLGFSEVYKAFLLTVIFILSLLTWKVKFSTKNFNTRNLRHLSFANAIFYGATFPLLIYLRLNSNLNHIFHEIEYILSGLILIGTVFLSIVFLLLPPLLPVFKEKLSSNRIDYHSWFRESSPL